MLFFSFKLFAQQPKQPVLFCYGDFYPEQVKGYTYVIIEGTHFSKADVKTLKENNKYVLGYISLGEVNEAAIHYEKLEGKTLGENKLWNSHILNLRDEITQETLLDLFWLNKQEKGLDGMFLDNIDNYTKYGPTPENKFELVIFLQKVKQKFPDIFLMQNAGLLIAEDTHNYIDAIAIESVASNYNFDKNKYRLRAKKEFKEQLDELETIHTNYQLPIIFIEYAGTKKMKKSILKRIKQKNWPYFIGQIDLQNLPTFK
ncbi:endo alpha-1,4 polygalactosaminidase [Mesonia aquimarina]|uniref:endo alpha-1,4 polygalactosaminidase n=1 Tax=Mesonia aquimarina TaxID=1504967 RepID=UPI0013CF14D3|nr:endo alpha-1,4 polygalactosaminidase [Mesonia aquimarina]